MTTYYVGPGGNNGSSGLTWALRKVTLTGAEDVPVSAGDTVYVGPGTYREQLILDVSGTNGNPITYIADVTGENTDGVGGIVRITGSDDDQTATRGYGINAGTRDYRTIRGFLIDSLTTRGIECNGTDNMIIEDCTIAHCVRGIGVFGADVNMTIRRCAFLWNGNEHIFIQYSTTQDANILIENAFFDGSWYRCIYDNGVGGITVRNCLLANSQIGVDVTGLPGGYTAVTVNNSIVTSCNVVGLRANVEGPLVEDFNSVVLCATARTNVATGGDSNTYLPLFNPPILLDGFKFPYGLGELSVWSGIRAITGTSEPSDDLFGMSRPATASKNSWGPMQFHDNVRETTTTRNSSTASIKFADAGRQQMIVPVTAVSTTIIVYCYRDADYAGTAPQLIVKQPGQSDDTTTDTGAASTWNLLTTTITPDSETDFIVVELVSNNTATSNDYACYFDDLAVK